MRPAGRVFETQALDGNGVKAMPGSIPAPNSLWKNKKIKGSQIGHTKKKFLGLKSNFEYEFICFSNVFYKFFS